MNHYGSFRLTILQLVSINLLSLVILVNAQNSSFESSENTGDDRLVETLFNFFSQSFNPKNGAVSSDCQKDSALYRAGLRHYKPWALQMYDSSTKIPFGFITGNYKQLGNYDECLRVRSDHGFVGKACKPKVQFLLNSKDDNKMENDSFDVRDLLSEMVEASGLKNWTFGDTLPYEWLWCVPSSCNADDVARSIEIGLDSLKSISKIDFIVTVGNDSCHTESSDRAIFATVDWIYVFLLLLFGIIIVASTTYDMVHQRNPEKSEMKDTTNKYLICFSLYTNGKSLLNIQRSADSITCLDGIRFITTCWVIYCHVLHLEMEGPSLDLSGVSKMHEHWHTQLYLNDTFSSDTFFLLSGILLAYSEMGRKQKNSKGYQFSIWKLYVHRYFRLTPSYAMIIGFYTTLLNKLGSGPCWEDFVGMSSDCCVKNWWSNLLYVNNYVNLRSICMEQSWYLAADMQMVWFSPIFLMPMVGDGKKSQMIFLVLLIIGCVASILTPFLITYCEQLTGTLLFYKSVTDLGKVHTEIYTRVYARFGCYLIGLGIGYFLIWIKQKKTTQPIINKKGIIIGGWTISTFLGLVVIFAAREMFLNNHKYNAVEAAFYAGFNRHVFGLALGWLIVACVLGYGGPVNTLLSWSFWIPLSKLSYSAYLTHYILVLYQVGSTRNPRTYTIFSSVHTFFGQLAFTLILSIILYLSIELPFCRLDQILFSSSNCTRPTSREKESIPEVDHSTSSTIAMSCNYYTNKDVNDDINALRQSVNEATNSYALQEKRAK